MWQDTMSSNESSTPMIDELDPRKAGDVTESGELERPQLRRKIDCAGNPEIADRRFVGREGRRSAARE
jgi:hypothetical protein